MSLLEGEIDQDGRMHRERFEVIVQEEMGREVFIQHLVSRKLKGFLVIPSKSIFTSLSILLAIVLDSISLENDIKSALKLIEVSSHLFVENSERGSNPRTYLVRIIESH